MPKSRVFNVANMSFNAFSKNKNFAKISEFTVSNFFKILYSFFENIKPAD